MKLYDLLELPIFKESKILTPKLEKNTEIKSVMVLEALDIEKWSRKNQIILTSFYALKQLSPNEMNTFFEKMVRIGISGIIVKVDRLIKQVPNWFIDLCYQNKIPLIKVGTELNYEQIILAIYQPILNNQSLVLENYYKTRQRLIPLADSLASYQVLVAEFNNITHYPCSLYLASNSTSYKSKDMPEKIVIKERSPYTEEDSEFVKNKYFLYTLESLATNQIYNATRIEFTTNNVNQRNSLLVIHKTQKLSESETMIFENFIDIIQNKLQTEYALKQKEYAHLNNIADAILQYPLLDERELDTLLDEVNLNHYKYYQACAFFTTNLSKMDLYNIRAILQGLKRYSIYSEHHDYMIILFNIESHSDQLDSALIKKKLSKYFQKRSSLSIVISFIKTKNNLQTILDECLQALSFNANIFINYVFSIESLGIFRYFLSIKDPSTLNKFIPQNLVDLKKDNYDLFKTLKIFFDTNKNYKKAAELLFVHEKTVRYRIKKIQGLLDLDLENQTELINYQISTYLLSMEKNNET